MSRFARQLRNELGRRYTTLEHLKALADYEHRLATVELLKFAKDLKGRPKLNSLHMLFRLRNMLEGSEFHEFVDHLVEGGDACADMRRILLSLDGMLREPRLTEGEKSRLGV
jgi:hypothetical protein